ncbi:MAG: hypothetical protein AB1801_15150, partial [Chloroflexota bacterium]
VAFINSARSFSRLGWPIVLLLFFLVCLFYLFLLSPKILDRPTGHYQVGYFTVRFAAPSSRFKAGNYLVLVYEGRHKLASTEFPIE